MEETDTNDRHVDAAHNTEQHDQNIHQYMCVVSGNTVIRMARINNLYIVVPIKHKNCHDLKDLINQDFRNVKVDTKGKRGDWMKVKWLRYTKEDRDQI